MSTVPSSILHILAIATLLSTPTTSQTEEINYQHQDYDAQHHQYSESGQFHNNDDSYQYPPQYQDPSKDYHDPEAGLWCRCSMFLVTSSEWLPEYQVFETGERYAVNCSRTEEADQRCRQECEQETDSVGRVFNLHPEALQEYPPSPALPCSALPAPTATFYTHCGGGWAPLVLPTYTHVCCHPKTRTPVWCDSIPDEDLQQYLEEDWQEEDRGLDLEKNPDDEENNEIEGSTKPESSGVSLPAAQSWLRTLVRYFGYDSLGELVHGFDIFSLPQRFKKAVKTYRDEVNMGQCYMEYTTYSIFTKGENPFDSFLRSRRDTELAGEAGDEEWEEHRLLGEELISFYNGEERGRASPSHRPRTDSKQAQIETIKSLVGSLVGMLEKSESTRRYASVIRQLLPVVTQVYAAEDPQQAVNTLVTSVLGPYLENMHTRKPKPKPANNGDVIIKKTEGVKSKQPPIPDPPQSLEDGDDEVAPSSPVTSIILNLVRQYMGSYFNTLPGGAEKPSNSHVQELDDTPTRRPSRPSSSFIPGNVMNLLNIFLGGGGRPPPSTRPSTRLTTRTSTTAVPKVVERNDNLTGVDPGPPKDFVDVVLEVIRPVFISILGKAPGDSGVASIREVSRLSVIGRVDDAVAQEVLSPYFCLKNYGVNKAWTLTERALRTFATALSPEERETMRALLV